MIGRWGTSEAPECVSARSVGQCTVVSNGRAEVSKGGAAAESLQHKAPGGSAVVRRSGRWIVQVWREGLGEKGREPMSRCLANLSTMKIPQCWRDQAEGGGVRQLRITLKPLQMDRARKVKAAGGDEGGAST